MDLTTQLIDITKQINKFLLKEEEIQIRHDDLLNNQKLTHILTTYAVKLLKTLQLLKQQRDGFQEYVKRLQYELQNRRMGANTFSSANQSVDKSIEKQQESMSSRSVLNQFHNLNWSEVFEVLEDAFSGGEERKGCQLLETLNYQLKSENTQQIYKKLIAWLQQAHRYKDTELRSIYIRISGNMGHESKDQQEYTFPCIVEWIHHQIDSILETRDNSMRAIDYLNKQIRDQVVEDTKKQIQGSSYKFKMRSDSTSKEQVNRSYRLSQLSDKKALEQDDNAERRVEEILTEYMSIKTENHKLKNLLEIEENKVRQLGLLNEYKKKNYFEQSSNNKRNVRLLTQFSQSNNMFQKIERQLSKQVNLFNVLQSNLKFTIFRSNSPEIDSHEDIFEFVCQFNKELQLLIVKLSQQHQVIIDHPNKEVQDGNVSKTIKNALDLIEKLVNIDRNEDPTQSMEIIEKLYVQMRIIQANLPTENTESVTRKLIESIIRIQKILNKSDSKHHRLLEQQRNQLTMLISDLANTTRSEKKCVNAITQRQLQQLSKKQQILNKTKEQIQRLTREYRDQTQYSQQKIEQLTKSKQQLSLTIYDGSKRISQLERQKQCLKKELLDKSTELKKFKNLIKEEKQNIYQKENQKADTEVYLLQMHNRQLEEELAKHKIQFEKERITLLEQVHKTADKLEYIQKLAEKKFQSIDKPQKTSTKITKKLVYP